MGHPLATEAAEGSRRIETGGNDQQRIGAYAKAHRADVCQCRAGKIDEAVAAGEDCAGAIGQVEDPRAGDTSAGAEQIRSSVAISSGRLVRIDVQRAAAEGVAATVPMAT